eukprot:8400762-Heterocapsa_arctica.AAC.1
MNALLDPNAIAINNFNKGLLEAYQQLTPETNNPFSIAGAYALDGENGVIPLAMVLMNRLRGLQAALI